MTTWIIDPGHSELQFKVKHLAIANVTGRFRVFKGEVRCPEEGFDGAAVHVTLEAASIDTNNPQRDGHLASPDFLDAVLFPEIVFVGQLYAEKLTGELSIKDVGRSVSLDVEPAGVGIGRFGDTRAGFEVRGKIDRKDFGLTFNVLAEGGGLVLGDTIALNFDIELIKSH
ncbi:YceI family protein [Dinghuibacter silviterrae]|uniref:Polyisoprenoid-binding protein YceI n=1 Tax=Dinghuibacter silviterrae TaxID=1539049 RepID=A0A4R8DGA9_9BACT|nr:YceI family protein [Dinghuibacter silviterrae]TDW96679.1 polyisoprenoid-binding protein YceI [Dinghuibacter silviterrae]